AALRKAIQVDPKFTPALGNLGAESFRCGELAGAERLIRRSLELDPSDPHMFSWLSFILIYTSRYDEALEAARRVRALSSERFYVTIAYVLYAQNAVLAHREHELENILRLAREDGAEPANAAMIAAYIAV